MRRKKSLKVLVLIYEDLNWHVKKGAGFITSCELTFKRRLDKRRIDIEEKDIFRWEGIEEKDRYRREK